MNLIKVTVVSLLAIVAAGCSKTPSQSVVCDAAAKSIAGTGIIDSVSQAKTPEGACKVLIVGDMGDSAKATRTVEFSYDVFDDGKFTFKVVKDEKSLGDLLPIPKEEAEILSTADKYVKAGLLNAECRSYIPDFLKAEIGFNTDEIRRCEWPSVVRQSMESWEFSHPAPPADPKAVCVELAKEIGDTAEYTVQKNGPATNYRVLPTSTPTQCFVAFGQPVLKYNPFFVNVFADGIGPATLQVVVNFYIKSAYGGFVERVGEAELSVK